MPVTLRKLATQVSVACTVQTMTTTDTRNVAATVEQVKRCADAGADLVRITVQGKKEAYACHAIREQLFKDRCAWTPLLPVSITTACMWCTCQHNCLNVRETDQEVCLLQLCRSCCLAVLYELMHLSAYITCT